MARTLALIIGLALVVATSAGASLAQGSALGAAPTNSDPQAPTPKASAKQPVPKAKATAKTPAPPPVPAKQLFGAATTAAPLQARAIGFYARGCLAGARPIAIDGPAWQVMRLSRNRNWGHPSLIAWLERFAADSQKLDQWPGLLVGDISQPRGGPMLTGHASHQIGLDADIWLTPMPSRRLTQAEREDLAATSMLADKISVNPDVFTPKHVALLKRAAGYAEVERILVHPAIKKAVCEAAPKSGDRAWLGKIRPYWGHFYHFHVRMGCPKDSPSCERQGAPSGDDGCGKELDDWFARLTAPPAPAPEKPDPPKPPMTLAELPAECRTVLAAPVAPAPVPAAAKANAKAK